MFGFGTPYDSHHVYEANTPKRPWHTVPNWPDHVTSDGMVAVMDKVGFDGAIFMDLGMGRISGWARPPLRSGP
jgi:hypothetical protein